MGFPRGEFDGDAGEEGFGEGVAGEDGRHYYAVLVGKREWKGR